MVLLLPCAAYVRVLPAPPFLSFRSMQVATGHHLKSVECVAMAGASSFFTGSWDGTVKFWAWPGSRAAADPPAPSKRSRNRAAGAGDGDNSDDGDEVGGWVRYRFGVELDGVVLRCREFEASSGCFRLVRDFLHTWMDGRLVLCRACCCL